MIRLLIPLTIAAAMIGLALAASQAAGSPATGEHLLILLPALAVASLRPSRGCRDAGGRA